MDPVKISERINWLFKSGPELQKDFMEDFKKRLDIKEIYLQYEKLARSL